MPAVKSSLLGSCRGNTSISTPSPSTCQQRTTHRGRGQQQQCRSQPPQQQLTAQASRRLILFSPAGFAFVSCLTARTLTAPASQLSAEADQALRKALDKFVNKGKAAVLLRLVFHDAGTYSLDANNGGLNASIQYELDRPENFGLKRGWRVIEQVQEALAATPAAGRVSNADLIALCGAQAVAVCGGPRITVPLGRVDAAGPGGDPEGRLPAETLSAAQIKAAFAAKGFTMQETLALLGSHTLGSKGFGDAYTFDNAYYVELLKKPWENTKDPMASMIGLPSDHVLPDDSDFQPLIQAYATNQAAFFQDFSAAYLKLVNLGTVYA